MQKIAQHYFQWNESIALLSMLEIAVYCQAEQTRVQFKFKVITFEKFCIINNLLIVCTSCMKLFEAHPTHFL